MATSPVSLRCSSSLRTPEAAARPLHAIVYGGYQEVEGVPIPTEWTFRRWSEERGPHGDPVGQVRLSNPRFIQPSDSTFARPPDAQLARML